MGLNGQHLGSQTLHRVLHTVTTVEILMKVSANYDAIM
jgi:hypothetical protein